jgi:hypothetical protein
MLVSVTSHAYFEASIDEFLAFSREAILGQLAVANAFELKATQRDAWIKEIEILQHALIDLPGSVFLEFNVPRIGSRIDAVVLSGATVFVLEFKVGEAEVHTADLHQAWDYALDLKNFHKGSHHAPIAPILVPTEALHLAPLVTQPHADGVFAPMACSVDSLRALIDAVLAHQCCRDANALGALDPTAWGRAPYEPTPTIIEAAQRMYAQHGVESITRNDAGAVNLKVTSARIEEVVDAAKSRSEKHILFVTGVPGAGKTLVGLNIATRRSAVGSPTHAVYLSGNGPLVCVLREALVRDEQARLLAVGTKSRKGALAQKVQSFIQMVHHFRDDGIRDETLRPHDHVVIFDEAQRAWNLEMTSNFMKRKKGIANFAQSEPQFLLSYLDRHNDWAIVVCLVGGGQEINRGEAGISEWLAAIRDHFPHWHAHISPELADSEYAAGKALTSLGTAAKVVEDRDLHLSVSMRSFRAGNVSAFVKAALDCDRVPARDALQAMLAPRSNGGGPAFPIAITRDLGAAKAWIRRHARGSERVGLVASSEAQRLKPHAIDVRVEINPVHWFLGDSHDTRSSDFLEDAATEFQVQGLELDWVCVTWDADLRFNGTGWTHRSFRGSQWTKIHKLDAQQYQRNAYRVLLTRARQGMVLFVPQGDANDPTREAAFYDQTFHYLHHELGLPSA